jgi:uncharacterized protein YfaS (alpha-2-macroglobulin family)
MFLQLTSPERTDGSVSLRMMFILAAKQFSVEEFVPDRIKVTAVLDKTSAKPGEKITTNITATNLFGPPAANRNYEIELQMYRKDFYAKKYSSYNFNIQTSGELHC